MSSCFIFAAPPGVPNVTVGKVAEGEIGVDWTQPASDGGSRIKQYRVYQKDEDTSSWVQLSTVEPYRGHYSVTKLIHTQKYVFGVAAENSVGIGEKGLTKPTTPKEILSKLL